jgi:hypothetical protein
MTAGALLLCATACASVPVSPLPAAPEPVTSVAGLVLPFDTYKPAPEQSALLGNAQARLVAQCMRRYGVTAAPPKIEIAAVRAGDPGNARRYGVADPEQAALTGYHLPRSGPPGKRPTWESRLSKSARKHLYGTRAHPGCTARASAALARDAHKADWSWLALQDSRTLEETARIPAVVQAVSRWRACMAKAGFRYPAPEAAIADHRWNLDSPKVSAEEKRTATADANCKWTSGLVATWFAADAALQKSIIADNLERFTAFRANLRTRLFRASSIP